MIKFSIEFAQHSRVGRDAIELLEAIRDTGSLSQAARGLGISYRHAWRLVDALKPAFREPVTVATRGGSGGGGVRLTALGESLVDSYRALEQTFSRLAAVGLQDIAPMISDARAAIDGASTNAQGLHDSARGRVEHA
jgi:molybdate transport system regulatory protein